MGAYWSVERLILVGFLSILVILGNIGLLAFRNTNEMKRAVWWVDHTYDAIKMAKELELDVHEAEAALRAYMLTGELPWREEYRRQAFREMNFHLAEVRRLTVEDAQMKKLDSIEPSIRKWVALFEEIRTLHETDPDNKARESELMRSGTDRTRRLIAMFDEFMERENAILVSRVLERETDTRFVSASIIASVASAYGCVCISLFMIFRALHGRRKTQEKLSTALGEKEILLKEVHHRVKNNLQVISSLLTLKSEKLQNREAVAVCSECCDIIYLMSRLHQQVYSKGEYAWVDFSEHLREIAEMLVRTQMPAGCSVALKVQAKPTIVSSEMAVPLSIIASEVILNSLKHAFIGRKTGTLCVEMHEEPKREVVIRDDGKGMPEGFDPIKQPGLGLELIFGLSRQIRCEAIIENSPQGGICTTIRFPATTADPKPTLVNQEIKAA